MLIRRRVEIFAIIIVLLISLLGEYLSISKYGSFTGGDTILHLRLTEELLRLEYPGSSFYPYPPGFHLLLAFISIISVSSPFVVIKTLQLFILLAVVLSSALFVYRKMDAYSTAIVVLLLLSSPAFWDRASQVIPQAFDMLLLPLAFYCFLEGKSRAFIALSTFLVYNHFAYALLPLGGLFFYSAFNQRRFKEFAVIGALSIPLVVYMALNISGVVIETASIQNLQEDAVLREPLFAIKYLGYPLFFLIFIAGLHQKFMEPSKIEIIARYWAFSLIPMALYLPDRFIEYVTQPMAIMGVSALTEFIKGDRQRLVVLLGLFIFTVASLFAFYAALLTNGEVFLPLDTLSPFAT